ncbi:DUF6049 family protein [Ornithinimicrobium sp. Y1847]|uniref:DUF6049 family protein n=1 Tax=Ornithinimicrobium sp. Y1847 TaxID=3405419 RepID=UPI003B682AAD
MRHGPGSPGPPDRLDVLTPARRPTWASSITLRALPAARGVLRSPGLLAARGVLSALLGFFLVLGTLTTAPPSASATVDGVRVVLDEVDPALPQIGEDIVLRGRVINDTPRSQRLTTITAQASWSPITSRAAVHDWIDGADEQVTGWYLGETKLGRVLASGDESDFELTIAEDTLVGLDGDQVVLGLELFAHDGSRADGVGLVTEGAGTLRTVLTVTRGPSAVENPLRTAWVVPLTLPADPGLSSGDDEVRLRAWTQATGAGSPARAWLDTFRGPGVTWLTDPSLLVMTGAAAPLRAPDPESPAEDDTPDEPAVTPEEEDPVEETPEPGPQDEAPATQPPGAPGADAPASTEGGSAAGGSEAGTAVGTEDADATASPPGADESGVTAVPAPTPVPVPLPTLPADEVELPAPTPTVESVEEGLVQLRGLLARASDDHLWWLPTGDPDLAALLQASPPPATVRSVLTAEVDGPIQVDRLLGRGGEGILWPLFSDGQSADLTALDQVWRARADGADGPRAVLVPREVLTASSGAPVTQGAARADGSGVTVLGSDSRATGLLAAAGDDALVHGTGATVQRMLADSLTAWQQDPAASRSMVIAPPRGTDVPAPVLRALRDASTAAPWLEPVPAARLIAEAREREPLAVAGGAPERRILGDLAAYLEPGESPLVGGSARHLGVTGRELSGLEEVLADPTAVRTWAPLLTSAWSTRWREDHPGWQQNYRTLRTRTTDAREGLHVSPSTVNFLADQGLMRVTIVNTLPVAVEDVRVALVPSSSILQVVDQPEPISIGADSRATVTFTARAVTRGETTVTARLSTPNGTLLGDSTAVEVWVQPTGTWIYWVLGGIAGIVLVLGIGRALRATPRAAAAGSKASATAPQAPPDAQE